MEKIGIGLNRKGIETKNKYYPLVHSIYNYMSTRKLSPSTIEEDVKLKLSTETWSRIKRLGRGNMAENLSTTEYNRLLKLTSSFTK